MIEDEEPDRYIGGDACVGQLAQARSTTFRDPTHDLRDPRKTRVARARRHADPDRNVLELVQAGDTRTAVRALMDRHGAAVYRYCHGALHDATLAEDVQQQVFIEAHRDLSTFGGRATLRTWLFGIARHRVLDAAKARTRMQARIDADNDADAPDPGPAPGERIDHARLLAVLATCLDELDDKVRTPLELRYQHGFTFEQIAEICGEKSGTLQVRVARALLVLRARLRLRTGGQF
jgi:RNA polymerase sigma-70 factor (ECF subfamily)